jgi:hypothetical protein
LGKTANFGAIFFLTGRPLAAAGFFAAALRAAGFFLDGAFFLAAFLFAAMISTPTRVNREK